MSLESYRDRYVRYEQAPQYIEVHRPSNGLGTAGFVLSLCSVFSSILGLFFPLGALVLLPLAILLCFLAFIFSFIGLFRQPKGLAIAGFVISLIGVIGFILGVSTLIAIISSYPS